MSLGFVSIFAVPGFWNVSIEIVLSSQVFTGLRFPEYRHGARSSYSFFMMSK